MNFKEGDKVIFNNNRFDRKGHGWKNEPALKFTYLTISCVTNDGTYYTDEAGGPWAGMYWELYVEPVLLDEELFIL